ncbi:hypothetical protein FJY71_07960, partial [candidate division WOR-3 bacterium]|nr:hypothetical protein [candidate division WOR-3 bacterium]
MKRLLVLALAAGLLAGAAAYPGWTGGRGLFRIQDARSPGRWNGSLMIHGTFATWPADRWNPEGAGWATGTDLYAQEALAAVSLSPITWF